MTNAEDRCLSGSGSDRRQFVLGLLASYLAYYNVRDDAHDRALLAALVQLPDPASPARAEAWWRKHERLIAGLAPVAERQSVPTIANVAGIRVGFDTIADAERALGPGKVLTGAHPQGARVWRIRGRGCVLYADGFESGPGGGYMVERLSLQRSNAFLTQGGRTPLVPAGRLRQGFWSCLPLGTSYHQAALVLRHRGLRPTLAQGAVTVKARGSVRVSRKLSYRSWSAQLDFRRGRLEAITVDANAMVDWSADIPP